MAALYDTIGAGYGTRRRPDPRIAVALERALGSARQIVNVGAGAGSYEPAGRRLVAVEPSRTMVRQRPAGAGAAVCAVAEALPFGDACFDASLAVLTLHHWRDVARGLAEMERVARQRVVVLTHDPGAMAGFWLEAYFPAMFREIRKTLPPLARVEETLGATGTLVVEVPHDCADGFLCAYWRRPEAYLDAGNRSAISSFATLPPHALEAGLARLAADLRSGAWERRNGTLRSHESMDLGYRIVVKELS